MRPDAPSKGFARLPEGEKVQVVINKAEAGEVKNNFYGKKGQNGKVDNREYVTKVRVEMEAVDPALKGAKVWFNGGFSINEKAPYRNLVIAAADRDPVDEEELLDAADTDNLVGRQLYIIGDYPVRDGQKSDYMKINLFYRVPRSKYAESFQVAPKSVAVGAGVSSDDDIEDF